MATAQGTSSAQPGLIARIIGVLMSPRETYAAVAARPRSLAVLAVVLVVTGLAQGLFLSTEVGQQAALDQQISSMEGFGIEVSDEMYAQMESRIAMAAYTGPIFQAIFWPLLLAINAGILLVVFSMLMGGTATFKFVYAVVTHSSVVLAVQQVFGMVLSYVSGKPAGANLGVFVPMLEETSFIATFLGSIDLFLIWWTFSLAIGLGVLYRRRTGPIAFSLLALYVGIALVVAFFRSGS